MYLREKLDELRILKQKSKELFAGALGAGTREDKDIIMKELMSVLDDIQNSLLVLSRINSQTVITVGTSKLDLNTAIIIRDNIKAKIDLITNTIKQDNSLDTMELMSQRDAFLEEYNSLNKTIRLADWSVKLD